MTLRSTFVRSESKVTWVFSKNNLVNDDVSELNSYYSWMLRNKNAHKYWHSWKTRKYVAWQKIWTCTIWTKEIELILPFWFLLKNFEHFETKGVFTCSKYCDGTHWAWSFVTYLKFLICLVAKHIWIFEYVLLLKISFTK